MSICLNSMPLQIMLFRQTAFFIPIQSHFIVVSRISEGLEFPLPLDLPVLGSSHDVRMFNYFAYFFRTGNLTEYRDSITVDNKSESGNLTANTSHTNLANVKENAINAQNRIYSAPIHMRNNSKHGKAYNIL